MGYQKAVVKYLQTWISTLTPSLFNSTNDMGWIKVSYLNAQQNEVILKKAQYS